MIIDLEVVWKVRALDVSEAMWNRSLGRDCDHPRWSASISNHELAWRSAEYISLSRERPMTVSEACRPAGLAEPGPCLDLVSAGCASSPAPDNFEWNRREIDRQSR